MSFSLLKPSDAPIVSNISISFVTFELGGVPALSSVVPLETTNPLNGGVFGSGVRCSVDS